MGGVYVCAFREDMSLWMEGQGGGSQGKKKKIKRLYEKKRIIAFTNFCKSSIYASKKKLRGPF